MSPPIRNKEHQRQIKEGLAGGVLQAIATDHCPFNSTQKRRGLHDFRDIPNGVNGIEERLHIAWDELVNSGARACCPEQALEALLNRRLCCWCGEACCGRIERVCD
jgi:dihydroorotase-like cyclic amidohydrolase